MAVIVAGGALAVAVSRDMTRSASIQTASEPVPVFEVSAADSPAPAPVPVAEPPRARREARPVGRVGNVLRGTEVDVARQANTAPLVVAEGAEQMVTAKAAVTRPLRTDDTVRSFAVAQAEREEARGPLSERKASVTETLSDALSGRRAAPDAAARLAEPGAAAPSIRIRGMAASAGGADTRLLHEERMMEGGREVRRRIYRVDGILVTLDERLPDAADQVRRAPPASAAAPAPEPRTDSVGASTNTIRWTDARGMELTLTGAASQAKLEQIRKWLGY